MDTSTDCFLCKSVEWFDEPLADSDAGRIVVGVGPLGSGYLLVTPSRHVVALTGMHQNEVAGFLALVGQATQALDRAYGQGWTAWEHGGCGDSEARSSSCVVHAHLHVTAGVFELSLPEGSSAKTYRDLTAFLAECAVGHAAEPYLLSWGSGKKLSVASDVGVPQFFRRQVAAQLGIPELWDYALAPRLESLRETTDRVREALAQMSAETANLAERQ